MPNSSIITWPDRKAASEKSRTAGVISLLTHTCISVGLHIVVHPQLTHAHQSSYHWGLHTNAATPAVEIPAIPSQIQILSQARLQVILAKRLTQSAA